MLDNYIVLSGFRQSDKESDQFVRTELSLNYTLKHL